MLTTSPSSKTRGPGMPCTTSSLTEMQATAGKGTLPGTPLNSGIGVVLGEELLDRGVDFAGRDAGLDQVRRPFDGPAETNRPALRIWAISRMNEVYARPFL